MASSSGTAASGPAAAPLVSASAAPLAPSAWDKFKEYLLVPFDKAIIKTAPEIGHLAPVIFTMGALFVSFITLNYPLFVFSLSSAEAFLVYNAISTAATYTATPFTATKETPGEQGKQSKCSSVFQSMNPSRFKYFMSHGIVKEFPNSPLYFISFAAAYCLQSMSFFSEEASELGPQYSNRQYIGILATALFITLYSIYLLAYGCDGVFNLLITIIIGLVVGYLICYQNYFLLGKTGVDLLFIPPIARRSGMDYICVTTNTPNK
jgi:hypothetical protein